MFLIFVCSTPRPMSSPDTVSNFSVSQCDHTCSMVGCHNHFSTASPQRDYMSQLTLSHDNLANSCGWWPSSHSNPPSETRHVSGNFLLQNQQYQFMSDVTCRFMCVFIFVPCLQPAQLETIGEVVYSKRTWVQATILTAAAGDCQLVIYKATRPGYFFGSHHVLRRDWLRNSRDTHWSQ